MIHIESTIQISSTRGGVFELLTDVDSYSKWQKGVVTSKHVSEGPMRVGFVFEETARIAFWTLKTVCTVNEYIPNQRFGFAATSNGPISYQGRFELQPVADGTRLTFNGSARLKGLWRLLEPLFGADLRKEAREELQSIKAILEPREEVPR